MNQDDFERKDLNSHQDQSHYETSYGVWDYLDAHPSDVYVDVLQSGGQSQVNSQEMVEE